MIKVTLDTNIIIKATKPHEVDYDLALRLLDLHRQNLIAVQVVAANASERGRSMSGTNHSLQGDLAFVGFSQNGVNILPTIGIVGMAYLDHFYLPSEETVNLIQDVWNAIFSPMPMDHRKFCEYYKISLGTKNDAYIDGRWQNHMCDVMTVVEYVRDCKEQSNSKDICILVTADDDDILSHANALQQLGARQILGLKDALSEIEILIGAEEL